MERLKKERNEALKEMSKLKVILNFYLLYIIQETNFFLGVIVVFFLILCASFDE